MEKRVSIPVTFPRDNPTVSYWQDPPDEIADLRSTSNLPESADVVIVGSGISGASIAHSILSRAPSTKVIVLEARQATSGATGRNGGHTKPSSYSTFVHNAETIGLEEAIKIVRIEHNNAKETHAFAKEHNIPCDSKPLDTVDIFYDQKAWDASVKAVNLMRKCMGPGDPAADYKIWNSEDAEEKFLCKGASGAITHLAGSISSYKFTIGLLKLSLQKGLNLQNNTPVKRVSRQKGANGNWTVETSRGNIKTSKVILATNGYTAALYPELQGVVIPIRGQITAHRPGSNMPKAGLETSYSFRHGDGFDYMIPRPQGSKFAGDIVIGGGMVKGENNGLASYGTTDDTVIEPGISNYLTSSTKTFFGDNWGKDDPEGRVRREWTGIMGYSPDGFPLVGEIPGEPGLYIHAAFQGHGMVLCYLCSQAFTSMLFGDDERTIFSWFPKAFKVTPERMKLPFKGKLNDVPLTPNVDEPKSHL